MTETEVTRLRNRARSMAESRMVDRYRAEYDREFAQAKAERPDGTRGMWRARVYKNLRHAHPYEWARIMDMALQLVYDQVGYVDGRKNNGRIAEQHRCYVIECPECRAPVKEPCRRPNGAVVRPHYERLYLA